jgi:hypothetical protein
MSSRSPVASPNGFGPSRFGIPSAGPASPAYTETASLATPGADDHNGTLMHPHNPFLAFAVIAATAFGLMAFSTSVRVGKTKAAVQIGDPK